MKNILRNVWPYRRIVALVFLLVVGQTQLQLLLPDITANIVNQGVIMNDQAYILRQGGIMLVLSLVSAGFSVLVSFFAARVGMGFGRDMRAKVFAKTQNMSLSEFDHFGASTLITRTTNDITQLQMVVTMGLSMMLSAPITLLGGIYHAIRLNASMSRILLAAAPVLVGVVLLLASRATPLFKAMQVKVDKLNLVLREALTGVRVIRAFNRDPLQLRRFGEANEDLTDNAVKAGRVMSLMMPMMMLILNSVVIAIMWYGPRQIEAGSMLIGDLMAFIQYIMQIMGSLLMVAMMFVFLPRAAASAVRVNEVLETEETIKDDADPQSIINRRGVVRFNDVSFRYAGAEHPVLEGISFSAEPGTVTAVVGSTGSGKSTLVNLIPRFYDVEKGSVTVDGVDVRRMRQQELRGLIGYVPQQASLFEGTLGDNVRVGNTSATVEDVELAAEVAQAASFIKEMPEGYETIIAQGGTNVSGGQKQRLTIARALVRKPLIYVFDDNFSALDYKTDASLRRRLTEVTGDATVFIVAQRVATVMNADRIIVLEEGRIAGMGTHQQLVKDCEVYREIVISQLGKEAVA